MGHTCNSIVIDAPYDLVFEISNDIPRWTELFGGEYQKAEILSKEGNKILFRLTDDEGKSWQSWRLLFKDKYMKIVWLYILVPGGVELTWIQHFSMDDKAKFNDQQVEGFINGHSKDNLKIFKELIEKAAK